MGLSLEVDEPIDPITVDSISFLVRDNVTSQDVAGSRSVSADGRTISFVPGTARWRWGAATVWTSATAV